MSACRAPVKYSATTSAKAVQMPKINPFRPNSPVSTGMFVGRLNELDRLEGHLFQTRAGLPTNFMVTGERGIGKSSLLNYFKSAAEGNLPAGKDLDEEAHFLVIDLDIDQSTTQLGLIRKIEYVMQEKLGASERARTFLKEAWGFLKRVEAAGVRIDRGETPDLDEVVFEEFSHSLNSIVERICAQEADKLFDASFDGVLLLIDEADNASDTLNLGTFLKLLLERLERRGCARLLVGLAGLPELRARLLDSHPSSVRLFDEVTLNRLTNDETNLVIDRCLAEAEKLNGKATKIADDGRQLLVGFSEGYPHFIQQFGYSAFAADTDDLITTPDVINGAFGKNGAMEAIGDRYYRDNFYNKIQEENYRQVLRIMADKLDGWVTKAEIRARFKGSDSSLDNAIKALRDRRIIFSKEGARGVYRLQHKGFALWIKMYTTDPSEISRVVRAQSALEASSG